MQCRVRQVCRFKGRGSSIVVPITTCLRTTAGHPLPLPPSATATAVMQQAWAKGLSIRCSSPSPSRLRRGCRHRAASPHFKLVPSVPLCIPLRYSVYEVLTGVRSMCLAQVLKPARLAAGGTQIYGRSACSAVSLTEPDDRQLLDCLRHTPTYASLTRRSQPSSPLLSASPGLEAYAVGDSCMRESTQ